MIGFVSGHGFSHAESIWKILGFSPCGLSEEENSRG
jgi:hypothetical protein